jgi:NADPH-dependent glutamate synthase beta subunit-like oxidoreductase
MDYFTDATSNLLSGGQSIINAKDKNVVVIGGGDTGTDCCGTAMRQGCKSLVNLEIVPKPPAQRAADNPWPQWPLIFRTDYGHAEAAAKFGSDPRQFAAETMEFVGDKGWELTGLKIRSVDWSIDRPGVAPFSIVEGSEQEIPADLVFLALGFLGPEVNIAEQFGLESNSRTNIIANTEDYETSQPGIFAAGDCRRGQSLVVWAIREGRQAATVCDKYLAETSAV